VELYFVVTKNVFERGRSWQRCFRFMSRKRFDMADCRQDSSKVGPKSDENGVQEGSGPPFGPPLAQCAPPVPPGSISLGDFPKLFVSTGPQKSVVMADVF